MKKQIITYCSIAYSITWIIGFGIFFLVNKGKISDFQLNIFHSFAATGPTIAAFATTYYFYGKIGIKKLFAKFRIKFPGKRIIIFIVSPLLFFVLGLIVYRIVENEWFNFQVFTDYNWRSQKRFISWLAPLISYAIFEEIGWRGFLLPHFQEKYNAWTSTIYVTIIWAIWHVPFFLYRFDFSIIISIGFVLGIFVGSIILTSIYNSNKGFLISVILFHFFNNLCSMFDKEIIVSVLSTGFVFVAIYIYKSFGKQNLSETERIKNYFKD